MMTRSAAWAGALGAALSAAGLSRWVLARHRAASRVAPDLQGPGLWFGLDLVPPFALTVLTRAGGDRVPATPTAPGVSVVERTVPGPAGAAPVTVRVYDTGRRTTPTGALLWIHGGGYVLGAARMDDDLCSALARDLGVLVVGVDYRLAPRHPAPAANDDCHAALAWLRSHADELRVDLARIAVGGASAGGGLAAGLVQRVHDEGVPVAFQLLEYPMLDDRTSLPRRARRGEALGRGTFQWTSGLNRAGWAAYLAASTTDASTPPPYAVPARREDLGGLPPAWIGVGDLDLFCPEDLEYARRLREAGVSCEVDLVPGFYHGADSSRRSATGTDFRRRLGEALRAAIA